jgi:hypothetical protein
MNRQRPHVPFEERRDRRVTIKAKRNRRRSRHSAR